MDGRRRHNRTGLLTKRHFQGHYAVLLTVLLLLLPTVTLFTQDDPYILMQGTPDQPVAGSTWTLTLLIAHSEPNEVNILAPHFDDALFLDQVLKGPCLRNPVTGQTYTRPPEHDTVLERWTTMEYRFVLNNPGTVSFESFTIIIPNGQIKTGSFDLEIQSPPNTTETPRYQAVWEGIPSGLKTGESAVIHLRINRWNKSANMLPEAALFLPAAPQGLILESLPILTEEISAGTVLKFRIIPLAAAPFVLERRQIPHGDSIFEIPAMRIPVSRNSPAESNTQHGQDGEIPTEHSFSLPFPALETATAGNSRLYERYKVEYETIYSTAKKLWECDNYARTLAILRQNERDHGAGSLFAAIRREAELILGFLGTNDEKRQNQLFGRESPHRFAVLRETAIRRIPDPAGEIIGYFREGQPVIISPSNRTASRPHETWLPVIANDSSGVSGWIPEESIIFY